jgi:hypothetical protein
MIIKKTKYITIKASKQTTAAHKIPSNFCTTQQTKVKYKEQEIKST